jgi:hypothetical protein
MDKIPSEFSGLCSEVVYPAGRTLLIIKDGLLFYY